MRCPLPRTAKWIIVVHLVLYHCRSKEVFEGWMMAPAVDGKAVEQLVVFFWVNEKSSTTNLVALNNPC